MSTSNLNEISRLLMKMNEADDERFKGRQIQNSEDEETKEKRAHEMEDFLNYVNSIAPHEKAAYEDEEENDADICDEDFPEEKQCMAGNIIDVVFDGADKGLDVVLAVVGIPIIVTGAIIGGVAGGVGSLFKKMFS